MSCRFPFHSTRRDTWHAGRRLQQAPIGFDMVRCPVSELFGALNSADLGIAERGRLGLIRTIEEMTAWRKHEHATTNKPKLSRPSGPCILSLRAAARKGTAFCSASKEMALGVPITLNLVAAQTNGAL